MMRENESWSLIKPVTENGTLLGFIAIHRGNKEHPAFGATRIETYVDNNAAFQDVLNLSLLMSHKAALANIPYGGGKGVLFDGPHMKTKEGRRHALAVYANHVNMLGGKFVTGSDVGVSQEDVDYMRLHSPHIVGVKEDPTKRTAEGLLGSIQVVAEELFNTPDLSNLTFAIQGVGKVGSSVLELLYPSVKKIIITDIDEAKVETIKAHYPNIAVCPPSDILAQEVTILIPCALGGVFNETTIPTIRARAIVGSANNQLASNDAGDLLNERDILYAPDYIVNAGGLISVVHEFEKDENKANLDKKIDAIKQELRNVLNESRAKNIPTHTVANHIAQQKIDDLFAESGMTP